ncbi:MAG: hypothetical protein HYX67_10225 [Candidatus Melainabacteria bacterium]|nr:hypothetical protein [Candidatus Melainabacteria bacterium]
MTMRFDQAIQTVEHKLNSGTLLVSDATIALLKILRDRQGSNTSTFAARDSFYEEAADALNKELLGYEMIEWDLSTGFRRCNIRTAKMVDGVINYIPNPLLDSALTMVWGSQQVEAFLAEVMDLSVFESGNRELIEREIRLLESKNPLFHTESGVEDLWVIFTGPELLRLYLQLKAAVSGVCEALFAYETRETFVTSTPTSFNAPMLF